MMKALITVLVASIALSGCLNRAGSCDNDSFLQVGDVVLYKRTNEIVRIKQRAFNPISECNEIGRNTYVIVFPDNVRRWVNLTEIARVRAK